MASTEQFRVPLRLLRFKDPVPAGLDAYVLLGMIPQLRNTTDDCVPILVDACCPTCGVWRVQNGRHRVIASIAAGRTDILAIEDEADEEA